MLRYAELAQYIVGSLDAKLASLRQIHTPLARILHKYLHQTSVVVGLAKRWLKLDSASIVIVGPVWPLLLFCR